MLIGGGFGSGKSHVLEHLAHLALVAGFVVSKVVISKETPLYDPAKVYRAAIDNAKVPGRPGSAIDEIAEACSSSPPATPSSTTGPIRKTCTVDSRFGATLFLYDHVRGDEEFADRVVRFWAGDPLPVADLRRRLKEAGAAGHLPAGENQRARPGPASVPLRVPPHAGVRTPGLGDPPR